MAQQSTAIEGGSLAYHQAGAGSPIMFVTGLSGRSSYWGSQVQAFSPAYQTVTFDHRGIGASVGPPPYSVEQWAADTLRLMDHLRFDRVHLVGHSTGGAIAQVLAADHPDRVASLVLGGTWARPDARFHRLFSFRKRVLDEMCGDAYDELGLILGMAAGLPLGNGPHQAAAGASLDVVAARLDALLAYDVGKRLRNITSPTLVIAAKDDVLVPYHLGEVIAGEVVGAQLVVFERGGHHFPQTQADAYNKLLRGFFRTHAIGVPRE